MQRGENHALILVLWIETFIFKRGVNILYYTNDITMLKYCWQINPAIKCKNNTIPTKNEKKRCNIATPASTTQNRHNLRWAKQKVSSIYSLKTNMITDYFNKIWFTTAKNCHGSGAESCHVQAPEQYFFPSSTHEFGKFRSYRVSRN